MKYIDQVYGEVEIAEPVILELINCPAMQRLKKINAGGYKPLWVKPWIEDPYNRFTHSVGVFLLLRKYRAPLEEQIAGLIHDVSHNIFSHAGSRAFGDDRKQDHQDRIFVEFVKNTEILAILKKYNFAVGYILNEKNFPLKEKDLPALCADRIDYILRLAVVFENLAKKEVNYFLDNLITEDNLWIFKNFVAAKKFAELFRQINSSFLSCFRSAVMNAAVGDYLRHALDKDYIAKDDLYTTDQAVLAKIEKHLSHDATLNVLFARMNDKIKASNNPQDYDAHIFLKSRIVDPLFKHNGQILSVSQIDKEYAKILQQELKPKEYFVKFEK